MLLARRRLATPFRQITSVLSRQRTAVARTAVAVHAIDTLYIVLVELLHSDGPNHSLTTVALTLGEESCSEAVSQQWCSWCSSDAAVMQRLGAAVMQVAF